MPFCYFVAYVLNMRHVFFVFVACLALSLDAGFIHAQPLIEQVDTSRFPIVEIRLGDFAGADRITDEDITLADNDTPMDSLIWESQADALPLKLALIVDKRTQLDESGTKWERTRDVTQRVLGALFTDSDSAIFIHAGGSIDNTDLNDNFPVLDIILQSLEPQGEAYLFDAIQLALEALQPVQGRRAILVVSQGGDEGSVRTAEQVQEQANRMGIPVHLYHVGNEVPTGLRAVSRTTGGKWLTVGTSGLQAEGIPIAIDRLRRVHNIRYVAPDEPGFHLVSLQIFGWESPSEFHYRMGGTLEPEDPNLSSGGSSGTWIWASVLLSLCVLGVGIWFYFRRKHSLHQATVVSPTLTDLAVDGKKGMLTVWFNLPNQQIPGRISIHSSGGRPVMDHVVSHRQSRAKIDLKEISEGVYHCSLSHAGLTSDPWEFVWERRG